MRAMAMGHVFLALGRHVRKINRVPLEFVQMGRVAMRRVARVRVAT